MDKSYTFAPLNGKEEVLDDITSIENEISRKIGEQIILIAYSKRNADSNNQFKTI